MGIVTGTPSDEQNNYYELAVRGPSYWRQLTPQGQALPFGYGYGLWWATQYPWARRYFAFPRWFPAQRWQPYYAVLAEDLVNYQYKDPLIDEEGDPVAIVDADVFGSVALPQLPTFASLNINLDPLTRLNKPVNQLREREKQEIRAVARQIDEAWVALKENPLYKQYAVAGYLVVPDLDMQRFMWIKDASITGPLVIQQPQPMSLATLLFS